jgi:hypothetical protein
MGKLPVPSRLLSAIKASLGADSRCDLEASRVRATSKNWSREMSYNCHAEYLNAGRLRIKKTDLDRLRDIYKDTTELCEGNFPKIANASRSPLSIPTRW